MEEVEVLNGLYSFYLHYSIGVELAHCGLHFSAVLNGLSPIFRQIRLTITAPPPARSRRQSPRHSLTRLFMAQIRFLHCHNHLYLLMLLLHHLLFKFEVREVVDDLVTIKLHQIQELQHLNYLISLIPTRQRPHQKLKFSLYHLNVAMLCQKEPQMIITQQMVATLKFSLLPSLLTANQIKNLAISHSLHC